MAEASIKLKVSAAWWAVPFLYGATWAAYPFLAFAGESATARYVEAVGAFVVRHGIKATVV